MDQVAGGIKALSRAILDDTKGEAEGIVAEAQGAARRVLDQAKSESQSIRADILAQAEAEIAHMEQQALATGNLEAQRIMLSRREQLIDQVFNRAEEQLAALYKDPGYPDILGNLTRDAVHRLGDPASCVIRVAEHDRQTLTDEFLEALADQMQGRVHLSIGDSVQIAGGVVIETPDGRMRFDNSLESRLDQEHAHLRTHVFRLLRGQS